MLTMNVGSLTLSEGFRIEGEAAYDSAGRIVSGAGDVNGDGYDDFIVGAPFSDAGGQNSGAAYVVFGSAGGLPDINLSSLTSSQGFEIVGEAADILAASSISSAGDINDDGFGDVIVGAYADNAAGAKAGAAFVIYGKASGFTTVDLASLDPADGFKITGDGANDQAGRSVSSAGDVNGDGLDDIIIGAPYSNGSASGTAAAYVIFGSTSGFSNIDLSTLDASHGFAISEAAGDRAGTSVAAAGDVNGDGFDDILIGAPDYGGYQDGAYYYAGQGAVYIVYGKAGGPGDIELTTLTTDDARGSVLLGDPQSLAGSTVSSAGDINGDGLDDIIFGETFYGSGGAVHVVYGSDSGFTYPQGFTITGAFSEDVGVSVSGAGDVNGDGFSDIIFGSYGHNNAYVIYGRAGGYSSINLPSLDEAEGFKISGTSGDLLGRSVAAAGDINGDGFDDVIVGAPNFREVTSNYPYGYTYGDRTGAAYVIYGQAPTGPVGRFGSIADQTIRGGTFDDTLDGREGNDSLYGAGGNDILIGGIGNDWLDGGTGSDTLIGGAGADTYVIDNAGDFVVERAGEGTDTVRSSRTYTLGDNVENLVLTGTATDGTGNELANILTGNAAANVLIGNGGNDTLIGGAGSDTLTGGAGIDTASYASAAVGVTVNLSVTAVQNTVGAGNDKINSVENVLGSAHNDTLTGNSAANTVEGGAGNDVLRGGSGNDTLLGDTGNDTLTGGLGADHMTGGAGDDVYDVEDAGDTVTEGSSSGGHDKVTSTVSFVLGSYLEDLTLMGSDPVNATGNSLANVLTGNSAANVLDGKGGADTMIGGTGNDFYYVDNASDVVKEGNATGGLDQVSSTVSFTLGSNIEQLTLTGSGAINGVGNNLANTMIGNGAVNSLKGAGGADTLDGRGGDDLVQGGAGRDMLTGGTGNDKFVFLDGDTSATRSLADHILDFAAGDKVDLHNIDANTTLATNQAFHFVGTAGFTVGDPGELHYSTGSGTTWIEGDTDGDGTADFAIYMAGDHTLAASDFVL